jgi:membrane protease YdiL (CAAX protease family)
VRGARSARLLTLALLAFAALAVGAPAAFAADGVGLWGPTDDKVVTYFGFAVIIFFAVLVTVLSLIQIRLESRKERLRQEIERLRPPAAE